ncbi:hypothetical protein M3P05_05465 [Sansalvadorimonas sp. 2012CJ34-2]|uniref:ISAzo13 family transposase n=1 Tax=Parendozoicomonas callyspongiae TaxID=2942213 RepID=A0ABT0PDE7_9GAMM|nr:hypothetical protein [Sansalvadorimonas sp. 2012CJ34-2]MCL6269394.1 hypothetical protein [Sansalvadorimonas sp. 2012CJ34-2]
MVTYPSKVKKRMRAFYQALNERERRLYAAVEALKLGHGGIGYVSQVLNCDQKTIHKGMTELDSEEIIVAPQRKKGPVVNL